MRIIIILFWVLLASPSFAQFVVDDIGNQGDATPGDGLCDNGSGVCTLRAAIEEANATGGPNTITFDPALQDQTINIDNPLILTNAGTTINGDINGDKIPDITVAAGNADIHGFDVRSDDNDIAFLNIVGFNGVGFAAIYFRNSFINVMRGNTIGTNRDGSASGTPNYYGVLSDGADGSNYIGFGDMTEPNVISNNEVGVRIIGGYQYYIAANIIGLNRAETLALPNASFGLQISSSPDAEIGDSGIPNVISGNGSHGIFVSNCIDAIIYHNLVGTNQLGVSSLGNGGNGILIQGSSAGSVLGSSQDDERNVFSANALVGVEISSDNVEVSGNYIGLGNDGSTILPNGSHGILVTTGTTGAQIGGGSSDEGNFISGNIGSGVVLEDGPNVLSANYIGTDATGMLARGNGSAGVHITGGSGSTIGGTGSNNTNIISGNNVGIVIDADINDVLRNFIGTDVNGTNALPNTLDGIQISGNANEVGDGSELRKNIISGNGRHGVLLTGALADGNAIDVNYIGLQPDGITGLPNGGDGVRMEAGAIGNSVGGGILAFNGGNGIGFDGAATLGNAMAASSIYSNGGKGISVTGGAHANISPPVVNPPDQAGNISGTALPNALVVFYLDAAEEGKLLRNSAFADALGNWTSFIDFNSVSPDLVNITAEQFDGVSGVSEFSLPLAIPVLPYATSITPSNHSFAVANNANITILFTEPIDGATLNASSVLITGDQSGILSGTFSGGGTTTITFDPDVDFKPNEAVVVTATMNVRNTFGARIGRSYSAEFRATSISGPDTPDYFAQEDASDIVGTFNNPVFVNAVDLDGDGDMDCIVSNTVIDQVAWYENNGSQIFSEHIITNNADFSREVKAFDLDQDGDLDIVGASGTDDQITWYENDGSENFSETVIGFGFNNIYEIDIIDFDGDGDFDVVGHGNGLMWLENDGFQSFTSATLAAGFAIKSIDVIDMESDGDLDVVVTDFTNDNIVWLENDGTLNFTSHVVGNQLNLELANVADFDGDGFLDVVASSTIENKIFWYKNDGSQNFTSTELIPFSSRRWREVSPHDLDADGDMDIVIGDLQTDHLTWLENDGAGNFTENLISTARDQPERVAVVDFDGDGDLDIFLGSIQDDKIGWFTNTSLSGAVPEIKIFAGVDNTGTEIADAQVGIVDFGVAMQGSDIDQTFAIENTGTADLVISSIAVGGSDFLLLSGGPGTIASGATATFSVRLSGVTPGSFNQTVTVLSNDADEATFTFPVSGMINAAVGPEIQVFEGIDNTGVEILNLQVLPVDIGSQSLGNDINVTFTIENSGSLILNLGTVTSTGADYTVSPPDNFSVSPGFTQTFDLQLSGGSAGTFSTDITITSDDLDETTFVFTVTGTITSFPEPEIAVYVGSTIVGVEIFDGQTTSLDIGNEVQGNTLSQQLTIENKGSSDLTIATIDVAGSDFSIVAGFPATIAAGASESFTLQLSGVAAGVFNDVLTITSNDTDEADFDFPVFGTIVASPTPEIAVYIGTQTTGTELSDDQLTDVDVGTAVLGSSPQLDLTIENIGTLDLAITNIVVAGSAFSVVPGFDSSVAPGSTTIFTLQLSGAAVGQFNDFVTIENDDLDEAAFTFPVAGLITAPPEPEIAVFEGPASGPTITSGQSTAVDIGSTFRGMGVTKTVTLENTGNVDLLISTITTGPEFIIEPGFPKVLTPGTTGIFIITHQALAVGSFVSSVSIMSNDVDEPSFIFPITSQVDEAEISVLFEDQPVLNGSQDSVDVGATPQFIPLQNIFVLKNEGTVTLTIVEITIENMAFELLIAPASIAPGESEDLVFELTATSVGIETSQMTIVTDRGTFAMFIEGEVLANPVPTILVYNAVSPNQDGMHDFLKVESIEAFSNNTVSIYNKLGNEVWNVAGYENSNQQKRFEGESNTGKGTLPNGTYYYVIEIEGEDGINGYFVLQR